MINFKKEFDLINRNLDIKIKSIKKVIRENNKLIKENEKELKKIDSKLYIGILLLMYLCYVYIVFCFNCRFY